MKEDSQPVEAEEPDKEPSVWDLLPDLIAWVVILSLFVAIVIVAIRQHADQVCRDRADDPNNVTLCTGEVYAVGVFWGECACQGAP